MTTEHVLATIDAALHDWETSPDAMRWAPDVAPPAPPDAALEVAAVYARMRRRNEDLYNAILTPSPVTPHDFTIRFEQVARECELCLDPWQENVVERLFRQSRNSRPTDQRSIAGQTFDRVIFDEFSQIGFDRGWHRQLSADVARLWDRIAEQTVASAESLGEMVGQALALEAEGPQAPPPSTDPRQRALGLRRSRNVGPPKPRLDGRRR